MAANLPFTDGDLRQAAGPASYSRGAGYLERVEALQVGGTWVTATVVGTDAYEVRLRFGGGGLRGECSCPFGAEGNFCKHCVATGLVALRQAGGVPAQACSSPSSPSAPDAAALPLISWLQSLSRDELLTELLELLVDSPDLIPRLELRAAAGHVDVDAVRDAIGNLIQIGDYVGYDEAPDYASDVTRAAGAIEELIEAGAAAQAIDVARDAIGWLREALSMADDSDGDIGNAGHELLDVHLLACQEAPPDPGSLAAYLAELCLSDQHGLTPAFTDYAELLGDTGWAALRKRIRHAYMAGPDNYRARHLMESIIEAEGDIDGLVAFYAGHLDDRGWQHLRIARKLDEAGRPDEALAWAERGVDDIPRPDDRLVGYLANRYAAAGRMADLVDMRRTLFEAARTLDNFRALRQAALSLGVWEGERDLALGLLHKDAAAAQRTLWSTWTGPVLVDALVDDGDLAAAWAAAQDIASEAQWIRLADACVGDRPADALAVYVKVIERLTQNTGDAVYRQILAHLLAVRACHEALGSTDKFRQYMALLRMGHKRKRNLMKILDENGL